MEPIRFAEANSTLTGAGLVADGQPVGDLPTYKDDEQIISCWQMTWRDRLSALLYGRVWLMVWSQRTHPPVALSAERSVFGAIMLALAVMVAPVSAQEPPASFSGVAAAGVSLSDDSAAIPVLRLDFDAPVSLGDEPVARLAVSLSLSGLPGESVDLQSVETWKAAEVFGELQRRVGADGQGGSTYIVGRAGFHTRILPTDPEPRDRYARSYGAGLRIERRDQAGSIRRSIALLYGRSDVASPEFGKGQLLLEGRAVLATVGGAEVVIGGDAYLNVSRTLPAGARDVLRLWVGAGWGG